MIYESTFRVKSNIKGTKASKMICQIVEFVKKLYDLHNFVMKKVKSSVLNCSLKHENINKATSISLK